jgi:hypothetical protein
MGNSNAEKNKAIVLEAFDTLFNKRDYARAEQFWSAKYIQHSAHIEPGRDGLFNLIKAAPCAMRIGSVTKYLLQHHRVAGQLARLFIGPPPALRRLPCCRPSSPFN